MKTQSMQTAIQTALEAVYGIALLRGVLEDEAGRAMLMLLLALVESEPDEAAVAAAYSQTFNALANSANGREMISGIPDAWQAYLVTRILDDTNPWSIQAERAGTAGIAPAIREQAGRDLRALRLLFDLTAQMIWDVTRNTVATAMPGLQDAWVPWYNLAPPGPSQRLLSARDAFGHRMIECEDWYALVEPLTKHWTQHGTGPFAYYHVLRWQGRTEGLAGIAHPDPNQLSGLIGYEREQALLQANLERFLHGLPAHDAVLYGAPGTGKSSTVKALVNAHANQGLRLVELRKEQVEDLPWLIAQLRDRAPRFLVFIDDLSFEAHETEYKALKVLLEGAAEARPHNVLIYATTNRLNLIREQFSERGKPGDDVHWRDTMEEKHSLVARFGLRVTFATPDQERYLKIAVTLAHQRGLRLPEEELRARALQWERQHTGRSGRLARQFVDELEAEQTLSSRG